MQQTADSALTLGSSWQGVPPWLVALVGTVVAALGLWLLTKVVKWLLWGLIVLVVIAGIVTAAKLYLAA